MWSGKVDKIYIARFNEHDDLIESVKRVAEEKGVKTGAFFIIGALKHVVLGYYTERKYKTIELNGDFEIASCTGNVALDEGKQIIVHSHIVVSNEKGEAFGGHLFQGNLVGPSAELVMFEAEGVDLQRAYDEATNLKLLKLG